MSLDDAFYLRPFFIHANNSEIQSLGWSRIYIFNSPLMKLILIQRHGSWNSIYTLRTLKLETFWALESCMAYHKFHFIIQFQSFFQLSYYWFAFAQGWRMSNLGLCTTSLTNQGTIMFSIYLRLALFLFEQGKSCSSKR